MENYVLPAAVGLVATALFAIKISRAPFWGILALVFFLPFERIPSVEVLDFTLKINHVVGGLLIVLGLLDLAFNNRKIRSNPTVIPIFLLAFSFILPFFNNDVTLRSLVFLFQNLFVIGLYFFVIQLVDSPAKLTKINKVFIWSSWMIVIFGFYQFFGDLAGLPTGLDPGYTKAVFGFPRIQAFSKEPLYLANYLLIPISIGFAHYFSNNRYRWPLLLLLGLLVVFALTISRGAFIALGFIVVFFLIFYLKKVVTIRNFIFVVSIFMAALVAVATIFNFLGQDAQEKLIRQVTIQDYGRSESTEGRLNAFALAIEAWRDEPWFGIGLGNYGPYTARYSELSEKADDIVNNQYLELLAETGAVGLGSFVFLVLVIAWRFVLAYRRSSDNLRPWLIGLFAPFLGTLVQYNFFSTVAIIHIWVLLGLLVAVEQFALNRKQ